MRVVIAQLGSRRAYSVPLIIQKAGLLERFFTDSYSGNKPLVRRMASALPRTWRPHPFQRWIDRAELRIPREKVVSFERLGWSHAAAQRRAGTTAELRRVYAEFGRRFNLAVIRHSVGTADTVYGFDGAALELFEWAKARGLRCVLEQTMAPLRWHDRILRKEAQRWPGWQPGLELPPEGACPLAAREEAEWRLADLILCGSEFVVRTMAECGGPIAKCRVVPYGVEVRCFANVERPPRTDAKLRVLFAGEVGLRKGAPYLLEALQILGPEKVEARFAGTIALAPAKLEAYRDVATFLGPVPRSQMPVLYAWADVFVLPTLCEGSASVLYEACAARLPVVTTENAGADLGQGDVRLLPLQSHHAVADALRELRSLTLSFSSTAECLAHQIPTSHRSPSAPYHARLLAALT